MIHHTKSDTKDIVLQQSRKVGTKQPIKCWNIKHVQRSLGKLCHILPVIHALTEYDMTSRAFSIGKISGLHKFKKSQQLCELVEKFVAADKKQDEIADAGQQMLVLLYDGAAGLTLDSLRYQSFCLQVAKGTAYVPVHALPPTSAAAGYQIYLQIQQWNGNDGLQPEDWGWKISNNHLLPLTTHLPPAPAQLLRVIRCNCKTECDSKRCSCRKHGMDCSPACGECHGLHYSNSPSTSETEATGTDTAAMDAKSETQNMN